MTHVRTIVELVAESHGVRPSDIYGTSKVKHVVEARFKAIAEVRRARPEWSISRLSYFFDRDRATIRNALRNTGDYA